MFQALYRICGVLYATFFAQLVGSLIIFDDLTFDQRFLIAATQVIATVQIISSGIIFAETLNSAHIVLCIVESALSFAYGAMAMRHDNRPLEKQCLASYWPSALSTSTLRPDILAMIGACFWVIGLACTCLKVGLYGPSGFHKHSKKEYPKTYKDLGAPKVLVIGTAICWIVMVYFTITTYTSAAHLKRDASDQELWTFGQILALCTIGTSVWQLVWCIIRKCCTVHDHPPTKHLTTRRKPERRRGSE